MFSVIRGIGSNRFKTAFIVLLLLVTASMGAQFMVPAQAPTPPWHDANWAKRRPVTISSTLGTSLADFQVRIDVDYDSDMKSDFSDLRFTESDGETLIPYWIETQSASVSAVVWVKVPSIPASSTTTIYMYYGNPSASSASNGDATFEFFDDFSGTTLNPSKWTEDAVNDITHTVNNYFRFEDATKSSGTYWIYDGTDTGSQHHATWTPSTQFIIEFKARLNDVAAGEMGEGFVGLVADDNTAIGLAGYQDWMVGSVESQRAVFTETDPSSLGTGVLKRTDASAKWSAYKSVTVTDETDWRIVRDGSTIKFYDSAGFFAQASITSTVSKIALVAGAFGPYAWLDYVQIDSLTIRKYASPEPSAVVGPEEDSRMKGWIIWWDNAWSYRKPITITENSGSALYDYQVKLTVDYVTSKMNPDFSDLRFTASDQVTLIPHWIESYTASLSAVVWVRISGISPSGSTTIYMYYGNPSASSASNGEATFEFFDDFETAYPPPPWAIKEPLPSPKADLTCAVYNDKLYAFGGYHTSWLQETYEYDPTTDTWTRKADMPTARWGMVAIEFDGIIYVFSGTVVGVNEAYNPTTDTWNTTLSSLPGGFNQGLMGVRYGDKIHLFYHTLHYEYDPATDTYTAKTPMLTSRRWCTCAVVGDKIYVIGGYPTTGVNEAYDPATDTWATKAPMPISKYGVTRENPVINGKIYVTHGLDDPTQSFHTDNCVYDPAMDTWEQKSSAVYPRDGVGCGVIDNKLYVVGGRDVYSNPVGIVYNEAYDPSADTGATSPWVFSDTDKATRDTSANYEGEYGLLIYEDSDTSPQFAEHSHSFATCAIDLCWDVTDAFGTATNQPQGRILLTDSAQPSLGSLYYYEDSGPKFKWYTGSFTTLQSGSWNTWYRVTIIWNGADSKVIIDGTEHSVSATQTNSDRIYLGTAEHTEMYFDLVRVRQYATPEPTASFEDEEVPANVESCDSDGTKKDTFNPSESIYVTGDGYSASTEYNVYIVEDVETWTDGMTIPTSVSDIATVSSSSSGDIPQTTVWSSALPGKYDIIIDIYENGEYDVGIDALDNNQIVETAGFFVIPEYVLGTVLAFAACFAAFAVYRRSKRSKQKMP